MTQTFDLLIRNATIVDGTGAARYSGDLGIRGDRIDRIGDLAGASGRQEIDLAGRVAAPGFIDAHTH
ncbi:MAG: D-aminoacylase, partial [Rhodoferax sp.]